MKKSFLFIALFFSAGILLNSCFHDHDMSITINDDDDTYRMKASFDEDQTRVVRRIINEHLHQHGASLDGYADTDVTLDDGTVFHIRTRPGRLKINFDRSENSEEGCERLKEMCDEIRDVLARGDDDR